MTYYVELINNPNATQEFKNLDEAWEYANELAEMCNCKYNEPYFINDKGEAIGAGSNEVLA